MADIKSIPNLNYKEFDSVDLSSWKKKIELDLKGKDWSNFSWEIEPGLSLDPAQFQRRKTYPPLFGKKEQVWVGQEIQAARDLDASNQQLLALLMKGVSAPTIKIGRVLSSTDLQTLFNNVNLEYLYLNLDFASLSLADQNLANLIKLEDQVKSLSIALTISTATYFGIVELWKKYRAKLANMRALNISIGEEVDTQSIAAAFNTWLSARTFFSNLTDWLSASSFQVDLGNNFLKEIGKLRAIHAVVNLICDQLQLDPERLTISTKISNDQLNQEAELAIIQLSNITLAANLGGTDQISFPVLERKKLTFYQRITSNIQHILSLESNLDKVGDPLAGSHFVEALTEKIATTVWQKMNG